MSPIASIYAAWLGVPPAAGRVMAALCAANGRPVSHDDLQAASGQTRNGLYLSIRRLRLALEPGALVNKYAEGFRLTAVGLAERDAALADAATLEVAA